MYTEHELAKKRKLADAGLQPDEESDEQLARRLHEELNALTRHSRRSAAVPAGPTAQKKISRTASAQDDKQHSKPQRATDVTGQPSQSAVAQDAAEGHDNTCSDREDKARKRGMLNRELAMLVVDMVESHVKPVTGARKVKGEHQHDDDHSTAIKHESSSSLSEQERLAIEQLHAAGADGKLVHKLLSGSYVVARTSDSGAAGDSCTTGATSSGKGSGHEQEQQQSSGQQLQHNATAELHCVGTVNSTAAASARAIATASASTADRAGSRPIKIPKLPMVLYGKKWYRAKVLKDAGSRVMLEYQGFSHEGGPFWLNKDHARIWRGSYKGKDWRYLGEGAWEPKVPMTPEPRGRLKCKAQRKQHSAGPGTASDATGAEDSDAEPQQEQQQRQQHYRKRAIVAAAAAVVAATEGGTDKEAAAEGAVTSERDTSSADQEGEGEGDIDEHLDEQQEQQLDKQEQQKPQLNEQQQPQPLTMDSPSVPDNPQQPAVAIQAEVEQQSPQKPRQQQQLSQQQQQHSHNIVQHAVVKPEQQEQEAAVQQVHQVGQQPEVHEELQQQPQVKQLEPKPRQRHQQQSESNCKHTGRQAQSAKQQQQQHKQQTLQQEVKQQSSRRRRQSEADASETAGPRSVSDSPAVKPSRRPASARASEKAAERAAAAEKVAAAKAAAGKAEETATAEVAAAVPAAPGNSSSERQVGEVGKVDKPERVDEKAEEVVSPPAKAAGRAGRNRTHRAGSNSRSAATAGDAQPTAKRGRGARSRSAATVGRSEAVQDQEQQQQQASTSNAGLQLDPVKSLKHSSSSEGIPVSPTSPPAAGGSPKATGHRRKGKPQRARLDSDDLQQPAKKIKLGPTSSRSNGYAFAYSNSDAADILDMSFEQAPPQPQPVAQQQQQQQPAHLGWKGGWKGAYKKGMWQCKEQQKQPEHQQQLQHTCGAPVQPCEQHWGEQQQIHPAALAVPSGEGHMHSEQQHVVGGSDPEDVEAACVLVGASMGRAHSGEVFGAFDQHQYQHHQQHRYLCEEQPLSPRSQQAAAAGRQNGRRRGHNWSKPLNRPPRPPPVQQQQQQWTGGARPQSFSGSLQQGLYGSNGELCQQIQVPSQEGMYAAAAAVPAGFSRQALVVAGSNEVACQAAQERQQQQQHSNGSYLLFSTDADSKQATLRALLDAVGEVQVNSGRPDLMYPLQYGGVPAASDAAKPAELQLPRVQVSAAAAALLAAVPSLETLHHMASVQGQSGLVACLAGAGSLSLFQ